MINSIELLAEIGKVDSKVLYLNNKCVEIIYDAKNEMELEVALKIVEHIKWMIDTGTF